MRRFRFLSAALECYCKKKIINNESCNNNNNNDMNEGNKMCVCVIKNKVNVTLCAGFDPKLVPVGTKNPIICEVVVLIMTWQI